VPVFACGPEAAMLNEIIKNIYSPLHESDWIIAETDRAFYELRMGGFKETSQFNSRNYKITYEFSEKVIIEEAYTDEEALYFRLSNNQYLIHNFANIDADGKTSANAALFSQDLIEEDYGVSFSRYPGFRKLTSGSEGNSD
jgi:hypothetical protein